MVKWLFVKTGKGGGVGKLDTPPQMAGSPPGRSTVQDRYPPLARGR